jgi:ribosomal protein L29
MSNMKEIRKKDDKGLVAYVGEKREEVRAFRFGTAGAGTRNVRAVRFAKKEIARALTELNARKRTESKKSA